MTKWPIEIYSDEVYIQTPAFEMYVGSKADMTSEEWQTVRLIAAAPALLAACKIARQELEHAVPSGCWSTGPLTGDVIQDHIICPGCTAISQIDAAIAAAEATDA